MKINKILTAVGVVAGFNAALLPLTSYATATCTDNGRQCADNVDVTVHVNPVIAMQITSNGDVSTPGVQAYSAGSEPTPDDSDAGPSLATGLTLAANQRDLTTLNSVVKVRSNTGLFSLTLKDEDTDTRLNLSTPSTTANEYIPAQSGEPVATTAGWAVSGGDLVGWQAMPASTGEALVVASNGTNTPTSAYSGDITVNYGVASGTTKVGTYSDTVVYTATTR